MCEDGSPPSDEGLPGGRPERGWDSASARMGKEVDDLDGLVTLTRTTRRHRCLGKSSM